MARPRGTDSAQVIQVIKTESMRGEGTQEDLCRIVTQYWDFDGNLLAENDPCAEENKKIIPDTGNPDNQGDIHCREVV